MIDNGYIKRSIMASIMISFGVCVLLLQGNPIGPFLFSLGLLAVCVFQLDLFTGKCGYVIRKEIGIVDLIEMLILNIISAMAMGLIFHYIFKDKITIAAMEKISTWEISPEFFLKSVMCGMIMFIAVDMYKKGNILGILLGVPLFIFCGFQHCIANIVIMGAAYTLEEGPIIICIIGNFIGSVLVSFLLKRKE